VFVLTDSQPQLWELAAAEIIDTTRDRPRDLNHCLAVARQTVLQFALVSEKEAMEQRGEFLTNDIRKAAIAQRRATGREAAGHRHRVRTLLRARHQARQARNHNTLDSLFFTNRKRCAQRILEGLKPHTKCTASSDSLLRYWRGLLGAPQSASSWRAFVREGTFSTDGGVMPDVEFTGAAIGAYLADRNGNSAPGPDGLPYSVLLKLGPAFHKKLAECFTHIYSTGAIPDCWRTTTISLMYKKGPQDSPASFRPIALSATTLKVFNALMANEIEAFCRAHTRLNTSWQKGFLKRIQGCVEHGYELHEEMLRAARGKKRLALLFIDFSHAFSTVRQDALWDILERYGIAPRVIETLKAEYANMRLQVEDKIRLPIERGTLQGDTLSPLLFTLLMHVILEFVEDKLETHSSGPRGSEGSGVRR
jgi:hypothetical protein